MTGCERGEVKMWRESEGESQKFREFRSQQGQPFQDFRAISLPEESMLELERPKWNRRDRKIKNRCNWVGFEISQARNCEASHRSATRFVTRMAGQLRNLAREQSASKETYSSYIYKVLKQVHPDTGISNKAMLILNSWVSPTSLHTLVIYLHHWRRPLFNLASWTTSLKGSLVRLRNSLPTTRSRPSLPEGFKPLSDSSFLESFPNMPSPREPSESILPSFLHSLIRETYISPRSSFLQGCHQVLFHQVDTVVPSVVSDLNSAWDE